MALSEKARRSGQAARRYTRSWARGSALGVIGLALAAQAWLLSVMQGLTAAHLLWVRGPAAAVTLGLSLGGAWGAFHAQILPELRLPRRAVWARLGLTLAVALVALAGGGALLVVTRHEELLPIAATLAVGCLLLPLASLLSQAIYARAGLWLCALGLVTAVFTPPTVTVGAAAVPLWPPLTGVAGALILWGAATVLLLRLMRMLRAAEVS